MEDEVSGSTPTCEQLASALEKNALDLEEANAFAKDLSAYQERANTRENGC